MEFDDNGTILLQSANSIMHEGMQDTPPPPPPPGGEGGETVREAFERYHSAVKADRYRVTAIHQDGRAMVLDKKDGVTVGFTPTELIAHLPEMHRLSIRGEHLYYTPLDADKHFVLVDDMSSESLGRLQAAGYQPAIIQESSPGNFQALLVIPKLGDERDREVGNRLVRQLNQEYGDPNLSGCVHPHRAPGFANQKPKHKRSDGSYPVVRLLQAQRVECSQALASARQIAAELDRQSSVRRSPARLSTKSGTANPAAAIDAYRIHYRDLTRRPGRNDLSRVDAMIAVRLRVTGHAQAEIEAILLAGAPSVRTDSNHRNWQDYAHRTAAFAFSPAGDRKATSCSKYRAHWMTLESPAPAKRARVSRRPAIAVDDHFGWLVVTAFSGHRVEVKCRCGMMRTVRAYDLQRKDGRQIVSCGCHKRRLNLAWIHRQVRKIPARLRAEIWARAQDDRMTIIRVAQEFHLDKTVVRRVINDFEASLRFVFIPARKVDARELQGWAAFIEQEVAFVSQSEACWRTKRSQRHGAGELNTHQLKGRYVWQATRLVQLLEGLRVIPARYQRAFEAAQKVIDLVRRTRAGRRDRKQRFIRQWAQQQCDRATEAMMARWFLTGADNGLPEDYETALET